jgi:chemotaxis family two-component system sensor kinase Cph1
MFASLIYATVDVTTGELQLCNAGHLPFVVVHRGAARLEHGSGTVIGVGSPAPPVTTIRLEAGDRVVLVTDGLIERRRENIDDGLERLRAVVESLAREPLAPMVEQLLMIAGPGDVPDDDIAVLAFDFRR